MTICSIKSPASQALHDAARRAVKGKRKKSGAASEASHAQELAKEKRRAVAADFLGRLKPFDKWVVERNLSEFDKEIYWRIVASLRKGLKAG